MYVFKHICREGLREGGTGGGLQFLLLMKPSVDRKVKSEESMRTGEQNTRRLGHQENGETRKKEN